MSEKQYGATPGDWTHWNNVLGLGADLLPVVSNPHATISPLSKIKVLGKTPSRYNKDRHAVGFAEWTQHVASNVDLARWSREPDYGVCVNTRNLRGIDIDVPDPVRAQEIEDMVVMMCGAMPVRERDDSGKRLMACYVEGDLGKRVLKVEGGIVEFLATGQQMVVAGTHPSGRRYSWRGGLPDAFPVLSVEQLDGLWTGLEAMFATEPGSVSGAYVQRNVTKGVRYDDSTSDFLRKSVLFRGEDTDGRVYFQCPWESGHSGKSGDSETVYFPSGSNGFGRSAFKCLHASCARRTDGEFLLATGAGASGFDVLPPLGPQIPKVLPPVGGIPDTQAALYAQRGRENLRHGTGTDTPLVNGHHHESVVPGDLAHNVIVLQDDVPLPVATNPGQMPGVQRDTNGNIKPLIGSVVDVMSRADLMGFELVYDEFRDEIMVGSDLDGWQRMSDPILIEIRLRLQRMMFLPVPHEMIRHAVTYISRKGKIDTAFKWLVGWTWDSESRAEMFFIRYLGCEDTPYVRALGKYLWTALAGRVLQPGCQVDIVPILVGQGGLGKTSLVRLLAPSKDLFMEVALGDKDADLSRLMRGKLVGEIGELRGLHTKEMEAIKTWVTRQYEKFIPKYVEYSTTFARRLVCIGTTDKEEFLVGDNNRRWAPVRVGDVDLAGIERDRGQLWAEGAAMFKGEVAGVSKGVQWQELNALMTGEHAKYKMHDSWSDAVGEWWVTRDPMERTTPEELNGFTMADVFKGALRKGPGEFRRLDEYRMAEVLREMGYKNVVRKVDGCSKRLWKKEE